MPVPHDRRGARIGELVTEILGSRDENLDDESVFQLSGKLALRIEDSNKERRPEGEAQLRDYSHNDQKSGESSDAGCRSHF
ncbi:MAG: hypothetical protein M1162_05395, partial [Candidatus Thermoplasmatota archaeon]|nr:hypothetical protein [Candidatus Thermoplasmatota archaeon]